jgi:hypothetical protein
MTVNQLLGLFSGYSFVLAYQINTALDMAVRAYDEGAVLVFLHLLPPNRLESFRIAERSSAPVVPTKRDHS